LTGRNRFGRELFSGLIEQPAADPMQGLGTAERDGPEWHKWHAIQPEQNFIAARLTLYSTK